MLGSIKKFIFVFVLLVSSVVCPYWIYNNTSGPDLLASIQKTSVSYLQLFTCDPSPENENKENVTNLTRSKTVISEHCTPNTTIFEFIRQQCSKIHVYLPIERPVRSVNVTSSRLKMRKSQNEENETKIPDKDESLVNRTNDQNDTDLNEIRRLPVPPDDDEGGGGGESESHEEREWNASREQLSQVFQQLGLAISKAALVLSDHAVRYPKDVCVVVVFLLCLIKMAAVVAGSSQRLRVIPRSASILSSASAGSDFSEEELVKPQVESSETDVPHTLESVRHLLPSESQPTIPCVVLRQGIQSASASSSETCHMRGIPDTFTILKNMPADIDVADIYLDTFRRMALQAGKLKTANLLKESQLFLEYRRNSYVKSNEQQSGENSSRMITADSELANQSTGSE